jgi:hypothetical protein
MTASDPDDTYPDDTYPDDTDPDKEVRLRAAEALAAGDPTA